MGKKDIRVGEPAVIDWDITVCWKESGGNRKKNAVMDHELI